MSNNSVVNPVAQTPSLQEMGALIAKVPQSESPISSGAKTQPLAQNQVPQSNIKLANTPETREEPTKETNIQVDELMTGIKKWGIKGIGVALTLQGLHGIYKSVYFILIEYPILEQQLVAHQVTQSQVNDFGVKAIMIVISTVLSMFFAMRLTFLKTKAAKGLSTAIGILLFVGNALIHDYFTALNSSELIVNFIIALINKIQGAPETIIEKTPFLEENAGGVVDTVWYK